MRSFLAAVLAMVWLLGMEGASALAGEHPPGPEVWFTPNPLTSGGDFLNMWTRTMHLGSPAAKKVDVLAAFLHQWLLLASDDQIMAVVNFAKRRHMKLDLEIEAVLRSDDTCGRVEGYVWQGLFAQEMAVLKRSGIFTLM